MKSGYGTSKGLGACEEALQRLLIGKPVVPEHVGLDLSKLTASIVSLEAGFDRGYLKKARKAHLPLLAQIGAVRAEASKGTGSSSGKQILQMESRLAALEKNYQSLRCSVTTCWLRILSCGNEYASWNIRWLIAARATRRRSKPCCVVTKP